MNQRIAFYSIPYSHAKSAYAMIDCAAANGMKVLEASGYTGCYSLEFGAPSQDSNLLEDAIETLSGWIKD